MSERHCFLGVFHHLWFWQFCPLFHVMLWAPRGGVWWRYPYGLSVPTSSLTNVNWLVIGPCISSNLLQEEASLIKAEWGIVLSLGLVRSLGIPGKKYFLVLATKPKEWEWTRQEDWEGPLEGGKLDLYHFFWWTPRKMEQNSFPDGNILGKTEYQCRIQIHKAVSLNIMRGFFFKESMSSLTNLRHSQLWIKKDVQKWGLVLGVHESSTKEEVILEVAVKWKAKCSSKN